MKEAHKGITPTNLKKCQVMKKLKKNQNSVRLTRATIDSLYDQATKLGKDAELILTLPISHTEVYKISCSIQKLAILKGE
jgi:hypothetical protein